MPRTTNTAPAPKAALTGWSRFAQVVVSQALASRVVSLDQLYHQRLIQAFASVPRDIFIPSQFSARAAEDSAFPIGFGQSSARPSMLARMLAVAGIMPGMRVLEIGCGSGYSSAVIAALGAEIFAIEYFGLMAQETRKRLDAMGLYRVVIRTGDGKKGWAEHGPYDAIIVSTAFDSVELELLSQLRAPGGRLVAPIGDSESQTLVVWEAKERGFSQISLEHGHFM